MSRKRSVKKYGILLCLLVLAGLTGIYVWHAESETPVVAGIPDQVKISPETRIDLQITDIKSGLRLVHIQTVQDGKTQSIVEKTFEQPLKTWQGAFTLAQADLEDGPFQLKVTARDRSWRNWLKGNERSQTVDYALDSRPPRISLESFQHNVRQGGSGVVAFRVSEPVSRAGVQIKDFYFPAYAQSDDLYLCFFSYPYSVEPNQAQLLVTATDTAGNANQAGFHHYVNRAGFDQSSLSVSDSFLQSVIVNFQDDFPDQQSLLDVFFKVNREMRTANRKRLQEIGRETVSRTLWTGRFLRQPNASREAYFGTKRKYVYKGKVIDEQTHLGIDLASIARAEVPAANSGRIVFADWLGIYGQVVIVDHGLGLQSLYAHLSQIQVQKGDTVAKGQILGRTGTTGLAGGDHLHFGMLVSGVPVNPVEWWDANWIANNVAGKLQLIQ